MLEAGNQVISEARRQNNKMENEKYQERHVFLWLVASLFVEAERIKKKISIRKL